MTHRVAPVVEGRALVLGDHVNADLLHPPSFFSLDPERVRRGFLAGLGDSVAVADSERSWIIVAGRNFGCGSSRETTLQALVQNGVRAVVARSFGRIFQRSAIARGLPCWCIDGDPGEMRFVHGEPLRLDSAVRALASTESGHALTLSPQDPYADAVLAAGGLLAWLRERPQ